jgi:hypothetical protein
MITGRKNMTREQYEQDLINRCLGLLRGELAEDLSDAELTRCLGPSVAGDRLVPLMQRYREQGGVIPSCELDRDDIELLGLMGRRLPYWAAKAEPAQRSLF